MRTLGRNSLALLIAITLSAAALAAETGNLKGTVTDSAGKALRGAIVSAIDEDLQKSISVLSDTQGRFVLDQLPPATYVVRARLVGYDDALSDELDVSAGGGGKPLALSLA